MALREELIELLAEEMLAAEPGLLSAEDQPVLQRYLLHWCGQFLLDKANELRLETANRLLRKRDNGVPWSPQEHEAAARYGVRPA